MRFQPRVINLSAGRYDLEGFARRKLRELEQKRAVSGVPVLRKSLMADGVLIMLEANSLTGGKIILIGGSFGHIMLAAEMGGNTIFSVYDYLKNKVEAAADLAGFSFGDTPLSMLHNKTCQLDEVAGVYHRGQWSAHQLDRGDLRFLGNICAYEQSYFHNTIELWVRGDNGLEMVCPVPATHLLLPDLCGPYLNLFSFCSYPTTDLWNQYRAASFFSITPTNGAIAEYGAWLPSFFVVEPQDAFGLKPGWYYGRYPNAKYDMDTPLTSFSVSLCGVLDTRFSAGLYAEGWAEVVLDFNGEERGDLYIYLHGLNTPVNSYAYRELVTTTYDEAAITIGSELVGYSEAFSLTLNQPAIKPDEVKLWNFASWTSEQHTSQDAVGLLVIEGNRCRGYRYKGTVVNFIDTTAFHSYAISQNGQMVAIFEGEEGLITSVKVFDLYGERDKVLVEEPKYVGGNHTLVCDSEVIAPLTALTACFIPFRAENFTVATYAISPQLVLIPDERRQFPSLSSLRFIKNAESGLQIDKVVCSNGVDAVFGISQDPCFSSQIVVDDPHSAENDDYLVSRWDAGGVFRGQVRGEFAGDHPDMRFNGVGSGDSAWYGVITLNPTLTILPDASGGYLIEGVAGELVSTTCLTEDLKLDPSCATSCDETITISAGSSCGQYGELVIEAEALTVFVSGVEDIVVGEFYGASGGMAPYQFSLSCGSIDADTGEVLSLSGCCGSGTVTAIDACGNSGSMTVRFPSGQWVLQSNSVTYPDGFDYLVQTLVSGNTRTDKIYSKKSAECSPQWYQYSTGLCVDALYPDSFSPPANSVVCAIFDVCGHSPTFPNYRDLPGEWSQEFMYSGECDFRWWSDIDSWQAGWYTFEPTEMQRVYTWECP